MLIAFTVGRVRKEKRMKRKCICCGRWLPKTKRWNTLFCNYHCRNKWYYWNREVPSKPKIKESVCENCGISFTPDARRWQDRVRFCRKLCCSEFHNRRIAEERPKKKCAECGEELKHNVGKGLKGRQIKYCNDLCAGNNLNKRRQAKLRPHRECRICGSLLPPKKKFLCSDKCILIWKAKIISELHDPYVKILCRVENPTPELFGAVRELTRLKRIILNGDDKTPLGANQRRGK